MSETHALQWILLAGLVVGSTACDLPVDPGSEIGRAHV